MTAAQARELAATGKLAGGSSRNGFPEVNLYRYRGERTMAADPKFLPCKGRCGRRIQVLQRDEKPVCAVCRGAYGNQRGGQ